jgi:hypothetical protein
MCTASGVENATEDGARNVALGSSTSLKNHEGKGVERVGEAVPARWRITSSP